MVQSAKTLTSVRSESAQSTQNAKTPMEIINVTVTRVIIKPVLKSPVMNVLILTSVLGSGLGSKLYFDSEN